ncbi:hypothetical protein T484DRAFT_1838754 [Baffinella frigidus]|nr:hypothetical protein T484DRAFT_1838754 [Cryptophyta sp. CCMP2293]
MSRSAARQAVAAIRLDVTGSVFGSRAVISRGALLPGRPADAPRSFLRPSFALTVVPAHLPRLSLGRGARSAGPRVGTDALALSTVGLGTRSGWGDVLGRALSGSRGGSSKGGPGGSRGEASSSGPARLNREITQCRDARGLLGLVKQHGESFDYIHVGSTWVTLVKMRSVGKEDGGEVIQLLQVITRDRVAKMGAQAVANIFHAMVTLNASGRMIVDDELVGELLARAKATAGDFTPQAVANLMWAVATMGIENPDAGLVKMMQRRAIATAGNFKPQGVAMLMWAFAKMDITPDADLVKAMQGQAMATAGDFKPQNIANCMWALATMELRPDADLVKAMQGQAMATAGDFNPQEVANLMWALATMELRPDAGLMGAMQRRAMATAGDFKPQAVAMLMRALATMDVRPDAGLVEAMQLRAIATARKFNPQDAAMLMRALKTMDITPDAGLREAMRGRTKATLAQEGEEWRDAGGVGAGDSTPQKKVAIAGEEGRSQA